MPRPPTIPEQAGKAIAWCQAMATRWSEHKAILRLTDEEVQELAALAETAAQARRELQQARNQYRAAAGMSRVATAAMRAHAGGLLARIRAVARTSASPQTIYSAARVPAPDTRSPLPAPGRAERFDVQLVGPTGTLKIDFACKHPRGVRGVTYRVDRSLWSGQSSGRGTPFEFFTTARKRSFTDASIPPGTVVVIYKVTAQTSTKDGPVAIHMVRLAGEDVVLASALPAQRGRAA
ncbi:MAG: hypothetical protein RIE32_11220 [Phycisphaerales bacterium]